jgi:hypothetical protein
VPSASVTPGNAPANDAGQAARIAQPTETKSKKTALIGGIGGAALGLVISAALVALVIRCRMQGPTQRPAAMHFDATAGFTAGREGSASSADNAIVVGTDAALVLIDESEHGKKLNPNTKLYNVKVDSAFEFSVQAYAEPEQVNGPTKPAKSGPKPTAPDTGSMSWTSFVITRRSDAPHPPPHRDDDHVIVVHHDNHDDGNIDFSDVIFIGHD